LRDIISSVFDGSGKITNEVEDLVMQLLDRQAALEAGVARGGLGRTIAQPMTTARLAPQTNNANKSL
jgi:hypothetical protein